jgi:hypothetical protein
MSSFFTQIPPEKRANGSRRNDFANLSRNRLSRVFQVAADVL